MNELEKFINDCVRRPIGAPEEQYHSKAVFPAYPWRAISGFICCACRKNPTDMHAMLLLLPVRICSVLDSFALFFYLTCIPTSLCPDFGTVYLVLLQDRDLMRKTHSLFAKRCTSCPPPPIFLSFFLLLIRRKEGCGVANAAKCATPNGCRRR